LQSRLALDGAGCNDSAMTTGQTGVTGLTGATNAPILLVEDDGDMAWAIENLLIEEGFVVRRSKDPLRGAALLNETTFSLVLTDYRFGSSSDSERLAATLLDAAVDVPVGCVTGWSTVPDELATRYAFCIAKPFDPQQLLARVAPFASAQGEDPARAAVIRGYFAALSARQWDVVVALCTDDVRYHLPGADPLSREVRGRDALRVYIEQAFQQFPDAQLEVTEISWLPRGAVASYVARWTLPDGNRATLPGAVYFRFEGAAIAALGVRMSLARLRALVTA
jgi:ketosteroid isomerase-like protein/CheY-like chemotaxis protein